MADPTPADRPQVQAVFPVPFPDRDRSRPRFPLPLTSFVGREREVAALVALLDRPDVRLVTLTGPGGVGKTRLAITVAERVETSFPDGVCFVELAPVADVALVLPSIAHAFGVADLGDRPLVEALSAHLGQRHLLLVLDNFEHVLDAGSLLTLMVSGCPQLTVLVTSRARLRISGERVVPIPPLALPSPGTAAPADVAGAEAVRLFVARAEEADAAFALSPANTVAIAEICRRLDGLPLAIELAAARVDVLPPGAMLARLDRRLPLLTGGARDAPTRLQTMRAAIAWSYDLLSPEERRLFRRLAVFPGGFGLEAAEAVADGAFEGIVALCAKSLLRSAEAGGDTARYAMLDTLREFGLEQLDAAGEAVEIRRRQVEYFVALAKRDDPIQSGSHDDRGWLDALEAEDDNLWSLLAWSLPQDEVELGLRIADAMFLYWYWRKRRLAEARVWLDRCLARARVVGVSEEVLALALTCASALAHLQDDARRSEATAEEALAIFARIGTPRQVAWARYVLAIPVYMQGDCERAGQLYQEAVDGFRAEGDRYWVAETLLGVAHVAVDHGDYDQAAAAYDESLRVSREIGSKSCAAMAQTGLGFLARSRGEPAAAQGLFRESLAVWGEMDDPASIAVCLEAIAATACALGAPARAARLLGAAEVLREQTGYPVPRGGEATYRQTVAGVQSCLTMLQFATAWVDGRSLAPREAIALASADLPDETGVAAPAQDRRRITPEGLTARELEVLRLLVQGLTDRQIAEALFVSRRTATTHVTNILTKLGLENRTAAAAWAVRHGLT